MTKPRVALILAGVIGIAPIMWAQSEQLPADERIKKADALFAEGDYEDARDAYRALTSVEDAQIGTRAAAGTVMSVLRTGDFHGAYRESEGFRKARPDRALIAAVHGAAFGQGQPAQGAQQGGLAAAVAALHPERFAGLQREADAGEQRGAAAAASELLAGETHESPFVNVAGC